MDEEDHRGIETEDGDDDEEEDDDELEDEDDDNELEEEDEDEAEDDDDELEEEEDGDEAEDANDELEDDDEGEDEVEEEESEEEEEEVDELDEITSPWVSSWMDEDGKTVHGIMVTHDDLKNPKNKCQFDDCSICYKPWTSHGKHQLCSLQCGHMYGLSCIKKWLLQSSSTRKCPQCNTFSSYEDIILLYPPRICVAAHQKASSTRRFPFTKQGYLQFKDYELSRMIDAQKLQAYARKMHADDRDRMVIAIDKQVDALYMREKLAFKCDALLKYAEELVLGKQMILADALRRLANPLKPRIDALERRACTFERRACTLERRIDALERRIDALGQRVDAFEPRVKFFCSMYKEHRTRLAQQKKNSKPQWRI